MIEIVNGTVVGSHLLPYKFFTPDKQPITPHFEYFSSDDEAIDWFRGAYPEHYRSGAEMRCYGEEQAV